MLSAFTMVVRRCSEKKPLTWLAVCFLAFDAAFNGNIASWDVSNVKAMLGMFNGASGFIQDLSQWTVSTVIPTYLKCSMKHQVSSLTSHHGMLSEQLRLRGARFPT